MREGWHDVRLQDVFQIDNAKLGAHNAEPTVLSISKHDGVLPAAEYFDKRVASASLDGYKILPPEGWAYSTIHIDEGSIARNTLGHAGVVSPMYTTLRWTGENHSARLFEWLLRQDSMLETYRANAQGSINRRRSLPWERFSAITVQLPSLPEQNRIVDLIDAVDNAIEAADAAATQDLYNELLTSTMSSEPQAPLSAALQRSSDSVAVDAADFYRIIGVARSGAGLIDRGETQGSSIRYPRLSRLTEGQLVYRKLTAWEGPISVTTAAESGGFVSSEFPVFDVDETILLPDLLRHMCRWSGLWERMGARLVGSVLRRKRLNPEQLLDVLVAMPGMAAQRSTLVALDAAWEANLEAKALTTSLRALRANLLSALLSGEHEIPASYDAILEGGS